MRTAATLDIRLILPARAEHVALCRDLLTGVARTAGLDSGELADLRVAVSEAVTNAVVHGSRDGESIEVAYAAGPGLVVVEVEDGGAGFDPAAVAVPADDLPEHGLGLALLRALADEFEVGRRGSGDGCRVRLVKRRSV